MAGPAGPAVSIFELLPSWEQFERDLRFVPPPEDDWIPGPDHLLVQ